MADESLITSNDYESDPNFPDPGDLQSHFKTMMGQSKIFAMPRDRILLMLNESINVQSKSLYVNASAQGCPCYMFQFMGVQRLGLRFPN